jgi:hypothetical protein
MSHRPLHAQPFPLPKDLELPKRHTVPVENVSHTPGQASAIRFFDPHSDEDLQAMREILKGRQVKQWMDDTRQISRREYYEWAGFVSNSSFLFAVLDAQVATLGEVKDVRGFIYIYSEREEKFRVRRMEKQGFIQPSSKPRTILEVSFAVRPLLDGQQSGSGLMSSGLRQACLQVRMIAGASDDSEVILFGLIDQRNVAAQRTVEASAFTLRGKMKYDADSPEESFVYILDWRRLHEKMREKLLKVLEKTE